MKSESTKPGKNVRSVYRSIPDISLSLALDEGEVRQCKQAGCAAFHNRGDIDTAELIQWLFRQLFGVSDDDSAELKSEGVTSWSEFRIKFQAKNERLKNLEADGELIRLSIALECIGMITAIHEAAIQQQESEYPTLLEGRTKGQIRAIVSENCKTCRDKMRSEIKQLADKAALEKEDAEETL